MMSNGKAEPATAYRPHVETDKPSDINTTKLNAQLLSDEDVEFNKELAVRYIDLPIFPGEREVTDAHVQRLVDALRAGEFNPHNVTIATALMPDGTEYKINGQHTAWAVFLMPGTFAMKVREQKYKVKDEDQLRALYSSFDRAKARSEAHVAKIHLAYSEIVEKLGSRVLTTLHSGYRLWRYPDNKTNRRVSARQIAAEILKEHKDLFLTAGKFYQETCMQLSHKHMRRVAVAGALFATFSKTSTKAPEFWEPVATGVGLEKQTDPRLKLRDWLTAFAIRGSTSASKSSVSTETMYKACLTAWNHWRDGKDVQILRTPGDRPRVK